MLEVVVGQILTGVMRMRTRPAVVHEPAMILTIISVPRLHKALKRPAVALPTARSVNPTAIRTIIPIPV